MTRIGPRHWIVAIGLAVGLHGAVAAAYFWEAEEIGAVSAGIGGIEVSLGPAGGAPGRVAERSDLEAETAEVAPPPDAAAPVEPPDVMATAAPPEAAQPADPPDQAAPVPAPVPMPREAEPAAIAQADPPEAVTVETSVPTVEPPDPPTPASATAVEATPVDATPGEVETVVAQVVPTPPVPRLRPKPTKPVRAESPPLQAPPRADPPPAQTDRMDRAPRQVAAAAPPSGSGGRSGSGNTAAAGTQTSDAAGGLPSSSSDYIALLQAWLERHKEYPRRAQSRRQEGTALLHVVIDRDGRVLEYRLEKSSGHSLLDREVTAMIKRAQPLPKMPDTMQRARLEMLVPVQFFLR